MTMLTSFNRIAKRDDVKIHPLVGRLVDQDVLKKLVNASASASADVEGDMPVTVN